MILVAKAVAKVDGMETCGKGAPRTRMAVTTRIFVVFVGNPLSTFICDCYWVDPVEHIHGGFSDSLPMKVSKCYPPEV